MSAIHLLADGPDDQRRRALTYRGDLLVFRGVTPLLELCEHTVALARDELGTRDPARAHTELSADDHAAAVARLQRRYRRDTQARRLLFAALDHVGVDLSRQAWDWLHLRVVPPGDGGIGQLGWHRDTWASNVYAQTNWWAPMVPIAAERSLAFHPAHWHRPVRNTSAGWDLDEVRARRRAGQPVALVPRPDEPVDAVAAIRVVPEPGDLLCFSGAHLHATVPNTTETARISIEARTVDIADQAAGIGAPNIDGAAPHVAHGWFRRVHDGAPLPDLLHGLGSP
jgi:hypothetical protein